MGGLGDPPRIAPLVEPHDRERPEALNGCLGALIIGALFWGTIAGLVWWLS